MKSDAQVTLEDCFRLLGKKEKANLLYHAKRKTPILCGLDYFKFTDGKGAG